MRLLFNAGAFLLDLAGRAPLFVSASVLVDGRGVAEYDNYQEV